MKRSLLKHAVLVVAVLGLVFFATMRSFANDMPTAAGSPIAGISFDDRPLILPVQRNFQMAMLTVSSELGRSCGRMEAYGWRTDPSEQGRVNQIFNNTVDRVRAQGYAVESKTSNSVSRDVTLFTADRSDKHLIFLWSAGEIGLVMVMCETSAPLSPIPLSNSREMTPSQPATFPSQLPLAETSQAVARQTPSPSRTAARTSHASFSPVGGWAGTYTCAQGTTGATLQIDSMKGDQFEGSFSFYPTAKNPYVPKGKYLVFGEYDAESQRILINPGKWIKRPKDYYNTIMIGSFDPVAKTFSGFFQGITGCTSFEANADHVVSEREARREATASKLKAKKPAEKKKATKKAKPKKAVKAKVEPVKKDETAPVKPDDKASSEPSAATPSADEKPRQSSIEQPAGIAIGEPAPAK